MYTLHALLDASVEVILFPVYILQDANLYFRKADNIFTFEIDRCVQPQLSCKLASPKWANIKVSCHATLCSDVPIFHLLVTSCIG
jgi:hypothetical protein